MPSILSAVSGQFTKYLVLGTLLPVAIFMALGLVFGQRITPTSVLLVHALGQLSSGMVPALALQGRQVFLLPIRGTSYQAKDLPVPVTLYLSPKNANAQTRLETRCHPWGIHPFVRRPRQCGMGRSRIDAGRCEHHFGVTGEHGALCFRKCSLSCNQNWRRE
jgi:hypothetical protein